MGLTLIIRLARLHDVDARPYVALTLATGSLGLLAYLARLDVSPLGESTAHETAGRRVIG